MENTSKLPLVTIGTLCYNTGKYVIEALECVRRQNYPNVQHIIIDDFSTDNSVQLIEEWIFSNQYECIFIKHDINRGVHYGLDEIFKIAKGDYLAMISDDLWTDDKLIEQVDLMLKYPGKAIMVYGDTMMIDETGKIIYPSLFEFYHGKDYNPPSGRIFKEIVQKFYFFIQAALIDLRLFKELKYKHDKKVISEDWDWQLAMAQRYEIYGLKKVYAKYRRLNSSITSINWSSDKFGEVCKSHFYMLERYFKHPLNTCEENLVVLNKLRETFWSFYSLKTCTYKDKVNFYYKIFRRSKSFKDLFTLINLIFLTDYFLRQYSNYKYKKRAVQS